jgi:membrane-bound lytic murein transglycosylase B
VRGRSAAWSRWPGRVVVGFLAGLLAFPGLVATARAVPGTAVAAAPDFLGRPEVEAFVAELVAEDGFERGALEDAFAAARLRPGILETIARPAERRLVWHEYGAIFLKADRIARGRAFLAEHRALLEAAEARYGVDPAHVVAILGVETFYGRITGRHRVLDALATLAFDYPPRSAFFRKELRQAFLLAREEQRPIETLTGSYAGAMGWGQFIPSSYRAYAVDFDGDGDRDIWNDPADAIGSVAHYLARHGWVRGDPVAVRLPDAEARDAGPGLAPAVLQRFDQGLAPDERVADLRALGLPVPDGVDGEREVTPLSFALADGRELWLGFQNFYAITRYNHSPLYAMAVHRLARALRSEGAAEGMAPSG